MLLLPGILAFMFGLFSQNYVFSIEYVIACLVACTMIRLVTNPHMHMRYVMMRILDIEDFFLPHKRTGHRSIG